MRHGHRFSQISEMHFAFITKFNNMTYENYLKHSESMLGWKLIEKIS